MPVRTVTLAHEVPPDFTDRLRALRTELEIPAEFPEDVQRAAERAIVSPRLPQLDRTDLALVTIDPPGSRDLDQAVHIRRDNHDFVVSYAIADVGAFVSPGDPLDLESHRRGLTLYAPDERTLLYPGTMSEGGASLLPNETRPALLWTIRLTDQGRMRSADVARAMVRSRAQLTYRQAQDAIDAEQTSADQTRADQPAASNASLGGPEALQTLQLLKAVGRLREQRERQRGGVSLDLPEQEVSLGPDGWRLDFRAPLPVEGWNAQISLLTGMAAAHIQLYGQVGILRTLPPADHDAIRRLHQTAKALRLPWRSELDYPEFVRSLDPARPADAAMLTACTRLFRGAGYKAFSGGVPEQAEHAALAIEYAHATAPLRRLVDRYVGEICVALCADQPVPAWVITTLDKLPAEMAAADRLQKRHERALLDLAEVFVLADQVGDVFAGTVIEVESRSRGTVMIKEPAVEARITGDHLPLGHDVEAKLISAEADQGAVAFQLV